MSVARQSPRSLQSCSREARGIAFGTEHDHLDVMIGRDRQPRAGDRVESPLEHVTFDNQRAHDTALDRALTVRTDVDQYRVCFGYRLRRFVWGIDGAVSQVPLKAFARCSTHRSAPRAAFTSAASTARSSTLAGVNLTALKMQLEGVADAVAFRCHLISNPICLGTGDK